MGRFQLYLKHLKNAFVAWRGIALDTRPNNSLAIRLLILKQKYRHRVVLSILKPAQLSDIGSSCSPLQCPYPIDGLFKHFHSANHSANLPSTKIHHHS